MRLLPICALLFLSVSACDRASSEASLVSAQPAPTEKTSAMEGTSSNAKDDPAAIALERVVRKGMAYADFRNEVIALGWTPVTDPQCKVNVAGADHASLCAGSPDLLACRICDEIPELSAYSGDARSLSVFRKEAAGLRLEVVGLGELKDWNVPGEDSGFQVLSWEVVPQK